MDQRDASDDDELRSAEIDRVLDRNWNELLQERRVAQTGTQILTGSLLTLPFSSCLPDLEDHHWYARRVPTRSAANPGPRSPPGRQRPALGIAGRRLHPDHRTLGELGEVVGAGVRAGRPDPGADLVDEVLDPGARRVQEHP